MHGGDLIHGDDTLRWRGPVTMGSVWPDCVVVPGPLFDDNAGFLEAVVYLSIE